MLAFAYPRRLAKRLLLFSFLILALPAPYAATADKAAEKSAASAAGAKVAKTTKTKYLRIVRDAKDKVVALETAIVTFVPDKPQAGNNVQVDLVAAVHIADKSYYQELNKRFAGYDVVLYELVAPEGTRIPKGGRKQKGSGNMLSAVQMGMKDLLDLKFQLDEVDYTRKNLVHADLSPEQFMKSMHDRKEGFTEMFARLLAYAMANQAKAGSGDEIQLLAALFDKNRPLALKRLMAEQFQEMEGAMAVLDGPKGSTLIGERNKRALEVLKKQIALGKKKIAIFYGGGHMPDMEKRLAAEFSLRPKETHWLQAWNMK